MNFKMSTGASNRQRCQQTKSQKFAASRVRAHNFLEHNVLNKSPEVKNTNLNHRQN